MQLETNGSDDVSQFARFLDRFFKIRERGSTIGQEFQGGVTTFLTMSYILLVNPQVLAKIGIPPQEAVIATALSSAAGCFVAGIFGNLPFGLSPGIGLSSYLVYGLVLCQSMPLHRAFTSCFIAGMILCFLSLSGLTAVIMRIIPKSVKVATVAGMGLQIALVGMTVVDMVVANPHTIVGLGPLDNYKLWFTFFGLILIGSLLFHQIRGSILVGIIIITVVTWTKEGSFPTSYVQFPTMKMSMSELINFDDIDWGDMSSAIIAFLFIGIVDVGAVTFGMASLASITESDGNVPGSLFSFMGCGVGTIIGGLTGSSPVIVYCETAAGIKDGSRTGLTAVVIGLLFMLSLFLAPVFSQVPVTATAPVSILVGTMMMSQAALIDWDNMSEAVPAFLTMVIMPFTFSITNGIMFGLLAACCFSVTTGTFFQDAKYFFSSRPSQAADGVDESSSLNGSNKKIELSPVLHPERNLHVHDYDIVRTPSLIVTKRESEIATAAHGLSVDEYQHHSHQHGDHPKPKHYSSVNDNC